MKKVVAIILLCAIAAGVCYLVFRNIKERPVPENITVTPPPDRPITLVDLVHCTA